MATFNGAHYLPDQLESILRQNQLPHELVVSDDGSTDETCRLVEHFASRAPFEVRLIRNTHPLQSTANFNQALSLCSGDLVFLSDQDDVWLEKKISKLLSLARTDLDSHVFMNDAEIVTGSLQRTGLTKLGQLQNAGISEKGYVMGCTAAIRGAFLKEVLPVPATYRGHDNWIIQIANGLGVRRIVRETLQLYRRHGGNVSQFVANRTEKISRFTYLLNRVSGSFSRNDTDDLQIRLTETRLMRGRVLGMRDSGALPDLGRENFEVFLERLKALEDAIQSRKLCLEKARIGRLAPVIRLYRQGKYRQFSGLESAFRDLLVK